MSGSFLHVMLRLFRGGGHNGAKGIRLQRGAANQPAVHVGLFQQLVGVAGVHAAAILHRGGLGHSLAIQLAHHFADGRAHCACSLVAVRPVPMAQTGS